MKLLLTCILCMFCGCVCAKETAKSANSEIIAHYVEDWSNTRTTHKNCLSELNHHLVLGTCPSTKSIDMFYLASIVAHLSAKSMLPTRFGKYLDSGKLNLKAHIHESYTSVGVRVNF